MELHVLKADAPSIRGSPIKNVANVIPQTAMSSDMYWVQGCCTVERCKIVSIVQSKMMETTLLAAGLVEV